MSITNDCCSHIIGRVPFHHASQGACMQFQPLGVITTLVFSSSHPFPKAGVNKKKYWNVAVWNHSLSPHDNISMDTELVMKGGMNWCCALLGVSPQGHPKVISRSLEGQTDKTWFLGFPNSKPIWGEGEFYKWLLLTHYWSGTISPRIARDFYAISALGDDYPLRIPLITPLSTL